MDLKSYKISNYLILIGLITGIIFNFSEYGWTGVSLWLPGILLPVLLLSPLFIIKVLGAGDIKLFSVIGSFYGITYVFQSIAAAFILGAVMSIIYLIKYKMVFIRFHYLFVYIQTIFSNYKNKKISGISEKAAYYDRNRDGSHGVIHFSIAVLGSVFYQIFMQLHG